MVLKFIVGCDGREGSADEPELCDFDAFYRQKCGPFSDWSKFVNNPIMIGLLAGPITREPSGEPIKNIYNFQMHPKSLHEIMME